MKKAAKLVVSKKMFGSTKTEKRKLTIDTPKKKRKKNTGSPKESPKKTPGPKRKYTRRAKPAENDSQKAPAKTKKGKGTEKGSKTQAGKGKGKGRGKSKDGDIWADLGVQRCTGCNFTTNEEGIFAAHLSLCRLYNKQKTKSPSPTKKHVSVSDTPITFAGIQDDRPMMLETYTEDGITKTKLTPAKKKTMTKPGILVNTETGKLRRSINMPDKQAIIQEPYLEGSSPSQTVFLFRCYHCRAYFINIQTLKEHHRKTHGTKNLTVSLVPFTDDEAPEDINKKIIVDSSRIESTMKYRKENVVYSSIQLQSAGGTVLSPKTPSTILSPSVVVTPLTPPKTSLAGVVTPPTQLKTSSPAIVVTPTKTAPSTIATPPTPPIIVASPGTPVTPSKTSPTSETVSRDVTIMKSPSREVYFQVTSSSDKGAKGLESTLKTATLDISKYPHLQSFVNNPKVVLTPASASSQSTNKLVVLNLIPKSQSVPCSPVQIEIPANSPLNTNDYLKQIPKLAKAATIAIQNKESSKNWNTAVKNKTILPKGYLSSQSSIDLPLIHQNSNITTNSAITVVSPGQRVLQSTDPQFTNPNDKQPNRKIILFPLTSYASSSGSLVTPGAALTATPITTSAVVTCATTTSPSMTMPLASSAIEQKKPTIASPILVSPTKPAITGVAAIPSVWVVPAHSNSTGAGYKLTSSPIQNIVTKQGEALSKTIQIKANPAVTKMIHTSTASLISTTQTVTGANSKTNRLVTITPVSEATPTVKGTSLLEKVVKAPEKTQDKINLSTLGSVSPKQCKAIELSSKSPAHKSKSTQNFTTDNQSSSKENAPSTSVKRKLSAESDVSISIVSPSPKKKAHLTPQTSSSNPNISKVAPSLSLVSSKGKDNSKDLTFALVSKKKTQGSTTEENSLNMSTSSNPLVIVRKSVGSNKLIVHTMVSAKKLFQIQDSDVLSCSLCTAKIKRDLMRNHLYWHFHVENRNSTKCTSEDRCHYCSVIDYVISMIPKSKAAQKGENTSISTTEQGQLEGDTAKSITESSGNTSTCNPPGLNISSSSTSKPKVDIPSNEEEGKGLPVSESTKGKSKPMKGKKQQEQSCPDLPENALMDKKSSGSLSEACSATASPTIDDVNDEHSQAPSPFLDVENTDDPPSEAGSPIVDVKITDESSLAGSQIVGVQNTESRQAVESPNTGIEISDETGTVEKVDNAKKIDLISKPNRVPSKDLFKTENLSHVEKNSIYKGNFYICAFKDCAFSSAGMEEFKPHLDDLHGEADRYSCIHCQLECPEPEELIKHMGTHLCGDMFIHYRCAFPECNFGTNLMKSFTQHNVGAHPRETLFTCYYCNADFQGCEALHEHLRANLLKYVHCPYCSVRNAVRDTILSHIKTDHPDKPRRIFVTGQMVCNQKEKVRKQLMDSDHKADSSDNDSDCMVMISDDDESEDDIVSCDDEESDCIILDDDSGEQSSAEDIVVLEKTIPNKEEDPKQTRSPLSNISDKVGDKIQVGNLESSTDMPKCPTTKTNEAISPKQTINDTSVLKTSEMEKTLKSSPKDPATPTGKGSPEMEEGSTYLQVKKVAHTYSRQKKSTSSSNQQQLEDARAGSNGKVDKDKTLNQDENSQDSVTSGKSCKRRLLPENKLQGKVDVGTPGLDAIISPLYLVVGSEVHCKICTFICKPVVKMHSHILLMHLHVYLYDCRYCHKKSSCKVEMREHCDLHGCNNRGFTNIPEPDWDQVIQSYLPASCRSASPRSMTDTSATPTSPRKSLFVMSTTPISPRKSLSITLTTPTSPRKSLSPKEDVTGSSATSTSPTSDKAKSTRTLTTPSPKKSVRFTLEKSPEKSDSVDSKMLSSSPNDNSSSVKNASIEDRNIFSLFSFGLEAETGMDAETEELRNPDIGKSSKHSKPGSSFSTNLFTLPSLQCSDEMPVIDQSTPRQMIHKNLDSDTNVDGPGVQGKSHHLISVDKEQYMKGLDLIAKSKAKYYAKPPNTSNSSFHAALVSRYPMPRLRSWRNALKTIPLVTNSQQRKGPGRPSNRGNLLIIPKTARKKIVTTKGAKLKLRKVPKSKKRHLLRSAYKLRNSLHTLENRKRKSLVKTSETRKSLLTNLGTKKSLLRSLDTKKTSMRTPDSKKSLLKSAETKKSLLKSAETKKSLLKSAETKKSLLKSAETKKSLLKSVEAKKSLLKSMETKKSLLKSTEIKKSLLKSTGAKKSLLKSMETKKSSLKTLEKKKSVLKATEAKESLLMTTETRKSLLKNPENRKSILRTSAKYVKHLRPENLKSKKSTGSKNSKPKLSKHLTLNQKKLKNDSQKLKASLKKTVVQKKNLTISHGQQSVKKALNQAKSRKSSADERKARLLRRKNRIRKGRRLKSLNSDDKENSSDGANRLFFSCSWCQFKVTDREHFQRHISLHNFFPQGCKMYCPYCSYTTPNALILERHIPMHMDKHPFGCRHCGFSGKTKMMVVRHCKRNHPEIPVKLVNRSTSSQKLKPSWPVASFSPNVRLKKCVHTNGRFTCQNTENKPKDSPTKRFVRSSK